MKNSVRSEVLPSVTTPLYQSPLRNVQWVWCCCSMGEVVFTNDHHSYPLPCANGFCIVSVMSVGLSTCGTSCYPVRTMIGKEKYFFQRLIKVHICVFGMLYLFWPVSVRKIICIINSLCLILTCYYARFFGNNLSYWTKSRGESSLHDT